MTKYYLKVIGSTVLMFVVVLALHTLLVMLGWSLFMVPVFGLKSLTFVQAVGLSLVGSAFRSSSIKANT